MPAAARRASTVGLACCGLWLLIALIRGGLAWTPAFGVSVFAAALTLGDGDERGWARPSVAFWVALAAYLSTFHWRGGDDIPTALLPFAVLKHGTVALDAVLHPFLDRDLGARFTLQYGPHTLSFYPIASGLLAIPLYIVPVLARAPMSDLFLHNLAKISGATITALSVAVFFAAVRRKASARWATLLTAIYAFGTWSWSVSSQALWQHGPTQLGLALALLGLTGESFGADLLCGFGIGLAVAARTDSVFLAAALLAYFLATKPRRLTGVVLGGLPWALQLAAYWLYFTGHLRPPDLGVQGAMLGGFSSTAFWGMLASPTRGVLLFCPAMLFGVWAAFRRPRSVAPWLAAGFLVHLVFLSAYQNWMAGMTFGQRYLSADAVVLLFLCVGLEQELSKGAAGWLWAQAAAFSVVVHALGAYFKWPGSFALTDEVAHLWDFRLHPVAQLAAGSGPLHNWVAPARWLAFLGAVALWQWLARRISPGAAYLTSSQLVSRKPANDIA